MGRKQCEAPEIPIRPTGEICIANASGGGGCFDARRNPANYPRESLLNYVCVHSDVYLDQETWIKNLLISCRGN